LSAFVLDASVTLGWMLDRPVPARAALARKLILAGDTPVVPILWRYEVSNAVVVSGRRGRLTSGQVETLAADLDEFSETIETDPVSARISDLVQAARRTNLTVYDAAYLELAIRRKLPLATLDEKLREAARRIGLELI
jgi:predicted nucleic acid-binding protein